MIRCNTSISLTTVTVDGWPVDTTGEAVATRGGRTAGSDADRTTTDLARNRAQGIRQFGVDLLDDPESRYSVASRQMFIQRSRKYFARSIQVQRKITSLVASGSHGPKAPRGTNHLEALRARLKQAIRRVAESERLVAGWREVIESEQGIGRDVSVARDLLKTFRTGLEVAMSDKEEAENALAQRLLDLFEGVRSRLPARHGP